MVRSLFCAVQMLLAVAFSMPGCAKNGHSLRAPGPAEEPGGLPVGTMAPEIAGEDIDGMPFKLSDYRGQVVLLDFWGNW
jgi:cytochrome oxidase Cu insertion factor (SCO1/SenC/PrrC family)